jgi:hypothetical protein
MSTFVSSTSRSFAVERITHANVFGDQIAIFPVDYRTVMLSGAEAKRMTDALKEAGFVGDTTLINLDRISVIEDAGSNLKVFLEGADRVVIVPKTMETLLFPALESIPPSDDAPVAKARRSKKVTT